jgi:folate-binding protein YgfZ
MDRLSLHEVHERLGARFCTVSGAEAAADYGDFPAEHAALREAAGVLDLSFRSRLCLTGADRARFLHGQVTNDIKALRTGTGCYAALTTAKGKMQSDLNIYSLADEVLLDFEPGLEDAVTQRLEKYIVADDVQIVDVASLYGLLSVQGPRAEAVLRAAGIESEFPADPFHVVNISEPAGDVYVVNQPRQGAAGFDLFAPVATLEGLLAKLLESAAAIGGRACGWRALDLARLEAGIPRFGADMDETNLPPECDIEARAMSYGKGCYIGQEVLNRIHSFGHVNRELRGLRLADALPALPVKGDKVLHEGKEVGYITSSAFSLALRGNIALGYVRREAAEAGVELVVRTGEGEFAARVVELPFT